MRIHHVIDALKGIKGSPKLAIPQLDKRDLPSFLGWMDEIAADMAQAQAFEFENVPSTPCDDGTLDLPGCESDELGMHNEGLIPLPYPISWFEIPTLGGRETLCFLIRETGRVVEGREIAYMVTPFHFMRLAEGPDGPMDAVHATGESWFVIRDPDGDRPLIMPLDEFGGAEMLHGHTGLSHEDRIRGESGMLLFLLLMLCSKTTEVAVEKAPAKLNKARVAKGKAPLPELRRVSIIPKGIAAAMRKDSGEQGSGMLRTSPRLHWRRSHLRTLKDGKRTVVARHLVGYKAEDGRDYVAHEYRVVL